MCHTCAFHSSLWMKKNTDPLESHGPKSQVQMTSYNAHFTMGLEPLPPARSWTLAFNTDQSFYEWYAPFLPSCLWWCHFLCLDCLSSVVDLLLISNLVFSLFLVCSLLLILWDAFVSQLFGEAPFHLSFVHHFHVSTWLYCISYLSLSVFSQHLELRGPGFQTSLCSPVHRGI